MVENLAQIISSSLRLPKVVKRSFYWAARIDLMSRLVDWKFRDKLSSIFGITLKNITKTQCRKTSPDKSFQIECYGAKQEQLERVGAGA